MVLPLIAIGVTTAVALAVPFFFPTQAETATVELNNKLNSQGSFLVRDGAAPQTGDGRPSQGTSKSNLDVKPIILLLAVALIIIMVIAR